MAFARGKLHIWNFKKWIRFTVLHRDVGQPVHRVVHILAAGGRGRPRPRPAHMILL